MYIHKTFPLFPGFLLTKNRLLNKRVEDPVNGPSNLLTPLSHDILDIH